MKNFYLAFAGMFLLTAGITYLNDPKEKVSDVTLKAAPAKKKGQQLHPKQPAYLPLQKDVLPGSRLFAPLVTATMTAAITNDVGLSGGSAGDEIEYTVTINNTGPDPATNVTFSDQINLNTTLVAGSVKVSPIAVNESYSTIGNVGLDIPAGSGVLANDISPNNATLSITGPAAITTAQAGTVTMNLSTGAFTYAPQAGYTGSDSFTYTLGNGSGLTSTATVTLNLTNAIWFVNTSASGAGENGTLANPFNSLADLNAINDGASLHPQDGHNIFIYSGSYTGPFTLRNSQKLIGQGTAQALLAATGLGTPNGANLLPATGGARPAITSSGNAINTKAGNLIQGLNVGATTGTKIDGTNFGTLTIKETGLSGNGRAINLATGVLAADFSEVSSTVTGNNGINISGASGSLKIDNGSITTSNATAIQISGVASNNRLALNATFLTVSSSNASKGVSVSNTSGTLQITGTGTTSGSGGTIGNISGRGFEFINADGITLKNIGLTNANTSEGTVPFNGDNSAANAAVYANNVAGLTMTGVAITGTTAQEGINMLGVSNFIFNNVSIASAGTGTTQEEGGIYAVNSSGTCSITNSVFSNPSGRAAYFRNTNVNLSLLTVDNSTFQDAANGPGMMFEGYGNSQMSLKVHNGSDFLNCQTRGIAVYANNTSQLIADIRGNTMDNGVNVGTGIDIAASSTASVRFNVINNTAEGRNGAPLIFAAFDAGYLEGTVSGNTFTKNGGGGSGILYNSEGTTSKAVIKIDNNTISNTAATSATNGGTGIAINVKSAGGAAPTNHFTITNNNINVTGPQTFYNIDLNIVAGYVGNNGRICTNLSNNTIPVPYADIAVLRAKPGEAATQIQFEGGSTVYNVWNSRGNTPTGNVTTIDIDVVAGTFVYNQTCILPNVPALRVAAQEEITENTVPSSNQIDAKTQQAVDTESASSQKSETIESEITPPVSGRTQAPLSGETVTVNGAGSGFTLPANKNVTIKYKVTVNAGISPSVCEISNDGTVSATEFSPFATTTAVTALTSAPQITVCPGNLVVNPDANTCTSAQTLPATAIGCPAPTVTYAVAGNPITFPYVFPAGITTVNVTASNGIGTNATCSYTVTVTPTPAPALTQDPQNQSICVEQNASFSVQTLASGVSYQWQKKPFGGAFANIAAAQNATAVTATLTLTSVPLTDNQSEYRCVVTNLCSNSSTSNPATLTVNAFPTITLNPDGYQCAVGLGTYTASFTATPGAVITTDKGTVVGSTVTGIPTNQTAIITATTGTCASTLTVLKDCSLPVTLIDFKASKEGNTVFLNWRTASESNSDRFEIERSITGKEWQKIGSRKSTGESAAELRYSYVDGSPVAGENFYRLKMIDHDNAFAYSKIVSVRFANLVLKSEFYPNPVSDVLYLKSTDWNQVKSVELHNISGQSVYRSGKTLSKTVQVKDFPTGMYVLTIVHQNGEVVTKKVLINR